MPKPAPHAKTASIETDEAVLDQSRPAEEQVYERPCTVSAFYDLGDHRWIAFKISDKEREDWFHQVFYTILRSLRLNGGGILAIAGGFPADTTSDLLGSALRPELADAIGQVIQNRAQLLPPSGIDLSISYFRHLTREQESGIIATPSPLPEPMRKSPDTTEQFLRSWQELNREIDRVHEPILTAAQALLNQMKDRDFGTLDEKRRIATLVQQTLNRLEQCILCTRDSCGKPGRLRCAPAPRAENGTYQCVHSSKETHGLGANFPSCAIVNCLPDGRLKSK